MSTDPIDAVIADLEARRAAIDQTIATLRALKGEPSPLLPGAGASPQGGIEAGTFFNLNIAEATKKYLNMVGKAQSTKQVSDALRKGSLEVKDESVAAILQRVVRAGDPELVNVGRGMWGLKRFYGK